MIIKGLSFFFLISAKKTEWFSLRISNVTYINFCIFFVITANLFSNYTEAVLKDYRNPSNFD